MLQQEFMTVGNKNFIRNYSDAGMKIERNGILYDEAIDPEEFALERIYTETDVPIDE